MVTSPKAVVRGYDWLDTLAHEYVHFVVGNASKNTVPIWMHEGLAKYLESRKVKQAALEKAQAELVALRKKLLPLTLLQFPYSKYWLIKSKWNKSLKDRVFLAALALPSLISKTYFDKYQKLAADEWTRRKTERNGSEMFLFFSR